MWVGIHEPVHGLEVPQKQDNSSVQLKDAEGTHRQQGQAAGLDQPSKYSPSACPIACKLVARISAWQSFCPEMAHEGVWCHAKHGLCKSSKVDHSFHDFSELTMADGAVMLQEVITADVVHFDTKQRFDRVVSIEMFEHMKNYQVRCELL